MLRNLINVWQTCLWQVSRVIIENIDVEAVKCLVCWFIAELLSWPSVCILPPGPTFRPACAIVIAISQQLAAFTRRLSAIGIVHHEQVSRNYEKLFELCVAKCDKDCYSCGRWTYGLGHCPGKSYCNFFASCLCSCLFIEGQWTWSGPTTSIVCLQCVKPLYIHVYCIIM